MKMVTKKVYCPVDKKLVLPAEQKNGETLRLVCPRCNTVLYVQEDWGWRFPGVEAADKK